MDLDHNQQTHYQEGGSANPPQDRLPGTPYAAALPQREPDPPAFSNQYSNPDPVPSQEQSHDSRLTNDFGQRRPNDPLIQESSKLSKEWQRRLYWIVPLAILAIVLIILFEVYKTDFERWVSPLTDWLRKREAWSWVLPVLILFLISFPPLFGHEIVLLIVGLTYPLGVALGICCAGAILGEAGCFVAFKYGFTWWVEKKIATKVLWAATARVAQQAGYRGVLVIRYSIIPPHLANPLFACTGMKFWIYMTTVILSLPKTMIFVALGTPASESSKGAKFAKVIAILVVVAISMFASVWIRKKMQIAMKEIEAERATSHGDEELDMLGPRGYGAGPGDTSYQGVSGTIPKDNLSSEHY